MGIALRKSAPVSIRDVCDLYGLTPRAVRYYEQQGLIAPIRDRQGHRRYDETARICLGHIAQFRRAGLALEDIREILADKDLSWPACALSKLSAQLASLERRRAEVQELMHTLSAPTAGMMRMNAR